MFPKVVIFWILFCCVTVHTEEAGIKREIDRLFNQSVSECAKFYPGDVECTKLQFYRNYRWEIIQDQDPMEGAPGVPGPPGLAPGHALQSRQGSKRPGANTEKMSRKSSKQ